MISRIRLEGKPYSNVSIFIGSLLRLSQRTDVHLINDEKHVEAVKTTGLKDTSILEGTYNVKATAKLTDHDPQQFLRLRCSSPACWESRG